MALTPALLRWLQSAEAAPWLEELTAQPPADTHLLPALERLRQHLQPDQAAALVETARLRRHAEGKFPHQARHLFFTRQALEQASPAAVAAHTARRFARFGSVADLGCGLGGDSLALAGAEHAVLAVDRDPVAVHLAAANARATGLHPRLHALQGDICQPAWRVQAAWADPGRRSDNRRLFDPKGLEPPLSALLALRPRHWPHLGIKLMPGLPHQAIPPEAECEWISLSGQLKEAVLWLGDLGQAGVRRATLLPQGVEIVAASAAAATAAPGPYLYEPDPAIIRAGTVADLAVRFDLWQIDREIAYLSGDLAATQPFARAWRILEHLPFDLKALNRRLRALQGQVVAVKKRGSPVDPEQFRRRLFRQPGGRHLVVVLTRVDDRPWTLICQEPIAPEP